MAKTMDPAYFVAWRKRMGLTQAQFAHKSGDHLVTVKRWETGARKLPPHVGWVMVAIENGLEPLGQEAMIDVDVAPNHLGGRRRDLKENPDPEGPDGDWIYERTLKKPDDQDD